MSRQYRREPGSCEQGEQHHSRYHFEKRICWINLKKINSFNLKRGSLYNLKVSTVYNLKNINGIFVHNVKVSIEYPKRVYWITTEKMHWSSDHFYLELLLIRCLKEWCFEISFIFFRKLNLFGSLLFGKTIFLH